MDEVSLLEMMMCYNSRVPLGILTNQMISVERARQTDFNFLTDIFSATNTPEFGGYNTAQSRQQGHARPHTGCILGNSATRYRCNRTHIYHLHLWSATVPYHI